MSLRLEMLQVARLAPLHLRESTERVAGFLLDQIHPEGGFKNRAGAGDLYYTVFGIDSLIALRLEPPAEVLKRYLNSFGAGETLDLVHTACLARCWAALCGTKSEIPDQLGSQLERFRTSDGGYSEKSGSTQGTSYGCFLAWGAYQDLGKEMPEENRLAECLHSLRTLDGAYANQPGLPEGTTTATAGAVMLLRQLGEPVPQGTAEWLLDRFYSAKGGFFASPRAPLPDLLSTATALHALVGMHVPLDSLRESCLDFLDTLWCSHGSFYSSWADETLDCEYTFYGLLALGHLSV